MKSFKQAIHRPLWLLRLLAVVSFCLYSALFLPLSAQQEASDSAASGVDSAAASGENNPELINEANIPVQLGSSAGQAREQIASQAPGQASGQTVGNAPAPATNNLVSASLYLRVFSILGFLIVLIYFTLKFLRRLSLQKPKLPGMGSGIQVLSSQVLHGDRMLHVVEVGGECYLLGSGANGVQMLDHYQDAEVRDRVILEATQQPQGEGLLAGGADFIQMLRKRLSNRNPLRSPGNSGSPAAAEAGREPEPLEASAASANVSGGATEAEEGLAVGAETLQRSSEYRQRLRSAAQSLRSADQGAANASKNEGGSQ